MTWWLPAQQHRGHNIGETDTHVLFIEFKGGSAEPTKGLGPTGPAVE